MKLSELLHGIVVKDIIGSTDIVVHNLSQDTREDFPTGTLYFAVPGTQVNGHDFIDYALEKGACVIICEYIPTNTLQDDITYIIIESIQKTMGYMVSNFFSHPSHALEVLAVTGTNGKTTVATLLYQSLLHLGQKVALFSTAGDFMNGSEITTQKKASSSMEIIEFHRNLKRALDNGCTYVCIEATSHALDQYRLNGTRIMRAVFTNLTQDHLDYHATMEQYALSKQKLFSLVDKEGGQVIVNIDDPYGAMMINNTQVTVTRYGNAGYPNPVLRESTFSIQGIGLSGTRVLLNDTIADVPYIGVFNMYNLLAVYNVLLSYHFSRVDIVKAIEHTTGAKGRMEIVTGNKEQVIGIVDYAHTPDALENVLKTLQDIPHNKTITVIGAGGDRDRGKRPLMAGIAQTYSNQTILTSDNPRTEKPEDIITDMVLGCDMIQGNVDIILEREDAIKQACSMANPNDIILVAGKGHEDYQIIGTVKYPFSDVEMLKKYL